MKKLFFFILGSAFAMMQAQTVIGKYAGEFMAIGVGGRPLGMGGAYTAIANDVTAAYYNPAGLAQLNYPQIGLMYENRYAGVVNYNYAGVALPYGADYTFALTITRLGIDGIPDTRNALVDQSTKNVIYDVYNPNARIDPDKVKEISNQDWAIYLSAAKLSTDNINYGVNVKFISRTIGEYSAFGVGFDIGALYKVNEQLMLGAAVQDITTTLVAWNTGRNELVTPTLKLGGSYALMTLGDKLRVNPAMDLDIRFENRKFASQMNVGLVSIDPHFGLELAYNNVFAIRGGYNDVKQLTIGAGVRLPKLNIDYTFARFSGNQDETLDATHRISLMITLEQPKFMRGSK